MPGKPRENQRVCFNCFDCFDGLSCFLFLFLTMLFSSLRRNAIRKAVSPFAGTGQWTTPLHAKTKVETPPTFWETPDLGTTQQGNTSKVKREGKGDKDKHSSIYGTMQLYPNPVFLLPPVREAKLRHNTSRGCMHACL